MHGASSRIPPARRGEFSGLWEPLTSSSLHGPTNYLRTNACQARASAAAARSISDSFVVRPSVNRTEPRAAVAGMPIANKTAEADSPPSWHAEPVDAATSGVAARRVSPETRGKRTLRVFGKRLSAFPLRARSGDRK